jgi:hypothetical protein
MVNPNRFYTYAYLREDRTPYYIGKGSGKRIYSNTGRPCNKPKDKSKIIFLKQNLTEEEAFKHEKYMIAVFGRKDLGNGILRNKTDGGEGASGFNHNEETRKKLSQKHKGKILTEEQKQKVSQKRKLFYENGGKHHMLGKKHSRETIMKMSKVKKGKKLTNEHKRKISKANKGKQSSKGMLGKTHSQETRRKMSEANKKRDHSFMNGRKWWNDGMTEKLCVDSPGNMWNIGRLYRPKDLNGKFV